MVTSFWQCCGDGVASEMWRWWCSCRCSGGSSGVSAVHYHIGAVLWLCTGATECTEEQCRKCGDKSGAVVAVAAAEHKKVVVVVVAETTSAVEEEEEEEEQQQQQQQQQGNET
ncbi:hypothetical protein E2C01_057567 [Portunus trituberculatus]|uniref:Uncharacterized protein n=1 Tax=Portunus trituberculatus TaxID=210409 RepID=A0A5B7H2X8_PORTR|nr:hypothetical protein [Portunus trituberculatus]